MSLASDDSLSLDLTVGEESVFEPEAEPPAVGHCFADSLARTYADRQPPQQLGTLHRV